VDDAYRHCGTLVRGADKERFLASLFVPSDRRPHLFALYAFNVEITRIRDVAHEPLPGEMRLQWWRDTLAGQGHGEVSAHPVAAALIDTIERFGLARETLQALIDAHQFDLYDEPMASLDDLEDYVRKTSSALIGLAADLLRPFKSPDLAKAIDAGGIAYGVAALLRAFPRHAARGQVYVPRDILARHGVGTDDVTAGHAVAGLSPALTELRQYAQRQLDDSSFERMGGTAAAALLPLALIKPLLRRLRHQDQEPFAPVEMPQWRMQWALWRSARRLR
jgi:15-cis-phytoene synthase